VPPGHDWLHEITYDSYRMRARIDGGNAPLLTRTGLVSPCYQGAFGEAAFTAAGFEGWLLAGIGVEDGLPAKFRSAATVKQATANIANQGHRVV
jgi:ATP-dependent DNA ligase